MCEGTVLQWNLMLWSGGSGHEFMHGMFVGSEEDDDM